MQVKCRTSCTIVSTEVFVGDHDEMVYLLVVHIKKYLNSHQNSLLESQMISEMRIPTADRSPLERSFAGKFQCRKSHCHQRVWLHWSSRILELEVTVQWLSTVLYIRIILASVIKMHFSFPCFSLLDCWFILTLYITGIWEFVAL